MQKLFKDFPQFTFQESEIPHWSPTKNTVYYNPNEPETTLHELGHAILGHAEIKNDPDLIKKERAAWDKAVKIGEKYNIKIDPDLIEDHLDTYRDWLHSRGSCPNCNQLGISNEAGEYSCIFCQTKWAPNDARNCRLYRRIKER